MTPATPGYRAKTAAAFTLVELLAVIAIIGVLAGILIASLGRMREAGRIAQGVSNLRQIGVALRTYAAANKDQLPYSFYSGKYDYALALSGYLDGTRTTYSGTDSALNHKNNIFKDPAARIEGGALHYSAHNAFMPSVNAQTAGTTPQVRLGTIQRPSQLIIVADGSQSEAGTASASLGNVVNIQKRADGFTGSLDDPVPPGPNVDGSQNGHIRWRLRNDTAAKFLFVDGHVEVRVIGELKYRNIIAD